MRKHDKCNSQKALEEILVEKENLKNQLARSQRAVTDLKKQLAKSKRAAATAAAEHAETAYELGLAQLIVNQSPVVLFRRKAGKTGEKSPTLEYVSDNLIQFGYEPKDLLEERIRYKDLVYQGDHEWMIKKINRYVDDDVEEYTEHYRLITKAGDIRWVEDQTSRWLPSHLQTLPWVSSEL